MKALVAQALDTSLDVNQRRRAYLDALIEAADGNLDMTWQEAHDLLAEGERSR